MCPRLPTRASVKCPCTEKKNNIPHQNVACVGHLGEKVRGSGSAPSLTHFYTQRSHYGADDPRVSAHAQVVVAAPDGHVTFGRQRFRVIVRHGEGGGPPVHRFKHAVRVVVLFGFDLLLKELIVVEVRDRCKRETIHFLLKTQSFHIKK